MVLILEALKACDGEDTVNYCTAEVRELIECSHGKSTSELADTRRTLERMGEDLRVVAYTLLR